MLLIALSLLHRHLPANLVLLQAPHDEEATDEGDSTADEQERQQDAADEE